MLKTLFTLIIVALLLGGCSRRYAVQETSAENAERVAYAGDKAEMLGDIASAMRRVFPGSSLTALGGRAEGYLLSTNSEQGTASHRAALVPVKAVDSDGFTIAAYTLYVSVSGTGNTGRKESDALFQELKIFFDLKYRMAEPV
ncbi:MAG: hypothetical protein LBQ51_02120 [Desulfovibrio sp.]|jgi:hypothetical protein|nr:hypothetical protein [Desulfovibrio sp.]